MPRPAAPGDFQITVDGIGNFVFGRRAPKDVFMIRGEYARLTGGNYESDGSYADLGALAYVTIKQMAVAMPDGFDPERMDPAVSDDWETSLVRVMTALREKELSFRPGAGAGSEAAGA